LTGYIHNIVVVIKNVLKSITVPAAGAPSVGQIMGPALSRNRNANVVGIENPKF